MSGTRTRFTTGNQAARKYTVEQARAIFQHVYDTIDQDEDILYLNTALKRCGYYSMLMTYLADIYAHDEEVVELSQRIHSELEERLVVASLRGKVKEATAIFVMKARFDMHETHRFQQVGEGDEGTRPLQRKLEEASPEKLQQLREAILALEEQKKAERYDDDSDTSAELAE